MPRVRARGEAIRRFIIDHLADHPRDIGRLTAEHFAISRQAVNQHLQRLSSEGAVKATGSTRNKSYTLAPMTEWLRFYSVENGPAEDQVWRDVVHLFENLPDNVRAIWQYGLTEIFNNALDHSEGEGVAVQVTKTAASASVQIQDNGVGIFRKIQGALGLLDPRHSVLELAKGKFTTDPANHSGEGIFFTSRMFDDFHILSGEVFFAHKYRKEDWILDGDDPVVPGTSVTMLLSNHTPRTTLEVFDRFTSDDDDSFSKTIVPVDLARYGDDNLISRSQAKRLLARVEVFRTVLLDFEGVDTIGQGFADEVFRVFTAKNKDVRIIPINANSAVKRMITRVGQTERG